MKAQARRKLSRNLTGVKCRNCRSKNLVLVKYHAGRRRNAHDPKWIMGVVCGTCGKAHDVRDFT